MLLDKYQHTSKKRLFILHILLATVILAADQLSKQYMLDKLYYGQAEEITSFFNLTLIFNPGSAFGLFADFDGAQRWILAGLVLLISIFLVVWIYRALQQKPLEAFAMSLILGGALGNLWDRVYYGVVIDFLDFHLGQWHWPAFNIADVAITIGVFLLIIDMIRTAKT